MGRSWKSAEISAFITTVAAKVNPDTRAILDLGVGDGDLAPLLMDRFRVATLRGIDRDETRLGLVEGRLAFYDGHVTLSYGDILSDPYDSEIDLTASGAALRPLVPDENHP